MTLNLSYNIAHDSTAPLMPVRVHSGSRLPLYLAGIPDTLGGEEVEGVDVELTNADGVHARGECRRFCRGLWLVTFAESTLARYGTVKQGVRVIVKTASGETIIGCADLVIAASSPDAIPGDTATTVQRKGDDEYLKSFVRDGVQHYKRVAIAYDEAMKDWGFTLEGDYIMSSDGTFIDLEEGDSND